MFIIIYTNNDENHFCILIHLTPRVNKVKINFESKLTIFIN